MIEGRIEAMEKLLPISMFIVGIFIGGFLVWFILRPKLQEAKNQGRAAYGMYWPRPRQAIVVAPPTT